jgi:RNA polymerase sigma factor (sigma-70 family)
MLTPKARLEKILTTPIRVFYHPSFSDPRQRKSILAEMPEYEKFQAANLKIGTTRLQSIAPEMRPCYEAPLLTPIQEQHLFRKMNYFKHKAKSLLSVNPNRVGENRVNKIEKLLNQAAEIRNEIAKSNFRLATQILKLQITFYREHSLTDALLSDAYFDVLKAVDYFNWTLGNRFSTYATWVVKKNFFRDSKAKIVQAERFGYLDEENAQNIEANTSGFAEEREYDVQKAVVQKLLKLLEDGDCSSDRKRQVFVLENYFGVNGRERLTLEGISEKIGVTKERVRQLKEKGLQWLRDKVTELGIEYSEEDEPN